MLGQMLQYLHILRHFLLTFDLLIELFLPEAFDRHEMPTQFMLCYADFTKGTLAKLVTDSIELMCCRYRVAYFLERGDYHRDKVLFVFKQRVKDFSHADL